MAGGRTTRGSPEGVEVGSSRHGARSFASYAPTDAGWSLDDYAYDPVAGEVVSRAKIAKRGQGATNAAGEAGAGAGASGSSEPENRREGSKRARRPPKRAEDFERDAPIAAKAGHVGATDTAGGESQRGGLSLDSDVASHDHRSGGASLASAPGSDGGGPNSSAPVAAHAAVGIRRCPVDGCAASCFPSSKRRVERVLCQAHVGALSCLVEGTPMRFCQVCYVLHGVDAFKGKNKTCTAVLERKKLLRARAMESRAPRESGAKSGGSVGGSGDGSTHGVSNGSLTQFHQAAATNDPGGRTPRGGTVASRGKRKASNRSGRRTSATDRGEGSSGGSGGGSGGSVVVPTAVAARPSKKKSTMLTSPAAAADDEAKRLSKGKSTQSDDSDPSDDPDSPAFDPWGVKTAVSPAHDTNPSLVGHHAHHATHGDANGGFFQNLWHGIGSAGSGGWHAQREREELERSLLRDMEHGALSSLVVPSAAIKVPNLTPEVFIARRHQHNEQQHVIHHHHHHHHHQHQQHGDESHLLPPPAAAPAARGAVDLGHAPIQPPGFTNCADGNWLGFFADNRVPGAHVDAEEDDGYDVFIRPGSLIFGVHSQSAVPGVSQGAAEMLRTAAAAGDDGIITRVTTRSRTRSRSGAANADTSGGGRGDSNTDTSGGSRGFDGSYDASGPDGLLRIPEGVFGSFNGEICKLEHDPATGEASAVPVRGAPEGLLPNALTAEESVLDTSSSSTARLTLPVTLDRSLALVCMFRGAHLPTTITRRGKRDTEVEICFRPKGGFRAAETWRASGGRRVEPDDTSDGSNEDAHDLSDESRCLGDVEGTATLEAIIAEGNMRGLPVGAAIPLLLTPDRELREEVVDAMSRLEFSRTAPAGGASPARTDSDGTTDSETTHTHEGDEDDAPQMPPPVALLSMLGAVLAARARGLKANPRLERGAAAMTRYFCLEHTAARIGCASPAGMFKYGTRYHPGRIGVGAYHDGGLLRGLFNALTAVIAALWHVRLVGFSCVVLAATVKTAMKIIGDGVVGGVPSLTGDIALSPAFLASVASASVPAVLYREALRFDAEGTDEGTSGIKRGSSKRWSTAHAKHAVRAQNRGAMIWPFVAIACVAVQLVKLRSDASLNTAELLLVAATEIAPAATLLASLQFPEWNTRSKRRANWPALSVTVHIARMVACLARGHAAYASRYSMYLGSIVDAVSATISVAMFPMWRTADAVQAQTGVVACDWIGHYLRTGTTPAYLVPGNSPLTPVEIWCHVVWECVWRVLTPAAVNALVMHRVVQSGRSKRRATVVEDAHSE